MLGGTVSRIFAGIASLNFLAAAVLLSIIGVQVEIHDGNYAVVYLGFGVWLECLYLATHFLLQASPASGSTLAERISQVLALIVLLPIGLIVSIQVVLLQQSIHLDFRHYQEDQLSAWICATLVLLLLVIPGLFILRFAIGLFVRRGVPRAEERA